LTCIIGATKEGKVILGGDSAAGTDDGKLYAVQNPKVFQIGEFLIGFTSSFRLGQLLQFTFSPPAQKEGQSDYEFICTDFIEAVRECFTKGGIKEVKDEVESAGTFLVGYRDSIYRIEDFDVTVTQCGFDACGSGEEVAMGAMAALLDEGVDIKTAIGKALSIAERFIGSVRAPFVILEQNPTTKKSAKRR
jgi:ATP-dependent protease HslVU (ClpYQ) peptidase subunit